MIFPYIGQQRLMENSHDAMADAEPEHQHRFAIYDNVHCSFLTLFAGMRSYAIEQEASMRKSTVDVMVIPPEHMVDRIVPDAMKAHLEGRFPGYSFAIDTMQSLPGDYYGFVQLTGYEGDAEAPTMEDYAEIAAELRAYGDGRDKLH